MAKLINLNVYDAKNMICVWNEKDKDNGYRFGIALDDAILGFMVPLYYIVGVFDDGSTKAAGIFGLSEINEDGDYDMLFLYDEFVYLVDIFGAKAFVRFELGNSRTSEKEARENVYKELLKSGVRITDEARNYLIS